MGATSGVKTVQSAGLIGLFMMLADVAAGETVVAQEFFEERSGYPCFATLRTDAEKSIIMQLSDYKDVWSLNFVISNRSAVYRRFFDSNELRDEEAFGEAFEAVQIGKRNINFNETSLFEVQRKDVDENTVGIFSIDERHNVAQALEAMMDDGIEIQGLVHLNGTADALDEFRSCSYAAIGLSEGERVKTDYRAEYRMIFEDAFENWIKSIARAEYCMVARFDGEAVSSVVERAAEAFYPGVLNIKKRWEYRADLERIIPLAKVSGMTDAHSEGCFMAGSFADLSRFPVDRAIESAEDID